MQKSIADTNWFNDAKSDYSSQHGEDGIIEYIFDVIGAENKWVTECGALNGMHDSNAHTLIVESNWSALMIEADYSAYEKLVNNYRDLDRATCVNSFISFEGDTKLDNIFSKNKLPKNFDLFVLDIDGNEYHVWDAMVEYKPRVMIVEFNQTIPNEISFIQPRDMSIQQGSSLRALNELGKRKGYRLVAVTDINAFFVREEDASPFENLENSLDSLRPHNKYETKIFQLYDGTLKIAGNTQLIWRKTPIDEEKIQVLSPKDRFFVNGLNSHDWVRKFKYRIRKTPVYPFVLKIRKIKIFRRIVK